MRKITHGLLIAASCLMVGCAATGKWVDDTTSRAWGWVTGTEESQDYSGEVAKRLKTDTLPTREPPAAYSVPASPMPEKDIEPDATPEQKAQAEARFDGNEEAVEENDEQDVLYVGHQRVYAAKTLFTKIAVGSDAVSADPIEDGRKIIVRAKRPGSTSIIVWDGQGSKQTIPVVVDYDPRDPAKPPRTVESCPLELQAELGAQLRQFPPDAFDHYQAPYRQITEDWSIWAVVFGTPGAGGQRQINVAKAEEISSLAEKRRKVVLNDSVWQEALLRGCVRIEEYKAVNATALKLNESRLERPHLTAVSTASGGNPCVKTTRDCPRSQGMCLNAEGECIPKP